MPVISRAQGPVDQDSILFSFDESIYGNILVVDYDFDGDHDILLCPGSNAEVGSVMVENRGDHYQLVSLPIENVYGMGRGYAWGDIDNDNDPDLVVTGQNANGMPTSFIYRNDGNGIFSDNYSSIEPLMESSAAFGDLDNDGDQDLVLSGMRVDGTLVTKVYWNIRNGLFAENKNSFQGLSSGSVLIVDLDNDFDNDIIINGFDRFRRPCTILYRNEGNGVFTELEGMIPGVAFGLWRSGDIDKDGLLDLIGIDGTLGILIIAFQNSDHTFTSHHIQLLENRSCRLDIGDVNSNGNIDVLFPSGAIMELSYVSELKIDTLVQGDFSTVDLLGDAAFIDWHRDDSVDVVRSSHAQGGTVLAFIHSHNSSPARPRNLRAETIGNTTILLWEAPDRNPYSDLTYNLRVGTSPGGCEIVSPMAVPDFHRTHGNGNCGLNNRWKLENLSPGTFYWSVQAIDQGKLASSFTDMDSFTIVPDYHIIDLPGLNLDMPLQVLPVDIDLDNDYDFLAVTKNMNKTRDSVFSLKIIENLGAFDFQINDGLTSWIGDEILEIIPSDINNDGYIDLAMVTTGEDTSSELGNRLVIMENLGGVKFEKVFEDSTGFCIRSIHSHDFDKDGNTDILVIGSASDTTEILLYINEGNFKFESRRIGRLPGISRARSEISDFDLDGYPELIIQDVAGNGIGSGNLATYFKILPQGILPDEEFLVPFLRGRLEIGDMNNDGYMDLLEFGNTEPDSDEHSYILQVYSNIKGLGMVESNPAIPGINKNGIAWLGDFDMDHLLDVYTLQEDLYSRRKEMVVYLNDSSESSGYPINVDRDYFFDSLPDNSLVSAADLDEDFDLDILICVPTDSGMYAYILRQDKYPSSPLSIHPPEVLMKTPTKQGVVLEWVSLEDNLYSYNVKIGSSFGGIETLSPNSNPETGFLSFPHHGNSEYCNFMILDSLADGKYYWSVQGISKNKIGGPWSKVDSFQVGEIILDFMTVGQCSDQAVSFRDLSTQVSNWLWYFGDGGTSNEQNPTHVYDQPGNYEVTLQTHYQGSLYTRRKMIQIYQGIKVDFDYETVEISEKVPIWNLTDTTGKGPVTWLWSFGDGAFSDVYDPVWHTYPYQGLWEVVLFGQTSEGCADSLRKQLIVCQELLEQPSIIVRGKVVWYLACSNDSARYYRWYRDGERIDGADEAIYVAGGVMGEYFVEISEFGECYVQSLPVTIPDYLLESEPIESSTNLKIIPNPSNGRFVLEMNSYNGEPITIEIISRLGQVLFSECIYMENSRFSKEINCSVLSPGVYLIRVRHGPTVEKKKVIIY